MHIHAARGKAKQRAERTAKTEMAQPKEPEIQRHRISSTEEGETENTFEPERKSRPRAPSPFRPTSCKDAFAVFRRFRLACCSSRGGGHIAVVCTRIRTITYDSGAIPGRIRGGSRKRTTRRDPQVLGRPQCRRGKRGLPWRNWAEGRPVADARRAWCSHARTLWAALLRRAAFPRPSGFRALADRACAYLLEPSSSTARPGAILEPRHTGPSARHAQEVFGQAFRTTAWRNTTS
jgi:hypothetical protein